jgi:hypothetical protein
MIRRFGRLLDRWWPVLAALGGTLVIQKVLFESRYDVSGHAAEHLSGASAPFFAVALVVILVWATPPALRQPDVLIACGVWLVATCLVLVGNVQVVDALIRAGMSQTPTEQIVWSPEIESAHGLANLAPWLGVIAALIMIAALWRRGHIGARLAIGASLVSLLFPPWIIPGAGVVVLVVGRVLARERPPTPERGLAAAT